jgi:hypothetical protein
MPLLTQLLFENLLLIPSVVSYAGGTVHFSKDSFKGQEQMGENKKAFYVCRILKRISRCLAASETGIAGLALPSRQSQKWSINAALSPGCFDILTLRIVLFSTRFLFIQKCSTSGGSQL